MSEKKARKARSENPVGLKLHPINRSSFGPGYGRSIKIGGHTPPLGAVKYAFVNNAVVFYDENGSVKKPMPKTKSLAVPVSSNLRRIASAR